MTQPTALFLADVIDADVASQAHHSSAAYELRRLHEENKRLAALVCDYAAEEAPDALRKVAADRDRWHTKAQQAEAQRDALLEALKELLWALRRISGRCDAEPAYKIARAAIAKAEGENT